MALAYLGLGANVDDRRKYIENAIGLLAGFPDSRLIRVSSLYETEPWGVESQAPFLNCAVALETQLLPGKLLQNLQELEHQLGRRRSTPMGPRTIDVDILVFGNRIIDEARLQVPHPRLAQRRFVLAPLVEIAADITVPGLGRTVESLLNSCTDQGTVRKVDAFFEMNWRKRL